MANFLRNIRKHLHAQILELTESQPNLTYQYVADQVGCRRVLVLSVMKKAGVKRPRGKKPGVLPVNQQGVS